MHKLARSDTKSRLYGQRGEAGQCAYLSGLAAEEAVARWYRNRDCVLTECRWRGQVGEIDLIFQQDETVVFVEVKKARTFDQAIARLSRSQMLRIHAAASQYLGTLPAGEMSETRFDLALVDQTGAVRILENAFAHF